mmetsp:Transcript_12245/g.40226  ORF Transcript_12245/g.40226 Transcript_12245/m.40226 type:complete len:185 (-) Transcript_12245:134-688(-)
MNRALVCLFAAVTAGVTYAATIDSMMVRTRDEAVDDVWGAASHEPHSMVVLLHVPSPDILSDGRVQAFLAAAEEQKAWMPGNYPPITFKLSDVPEPIEETPCEEESDSWEEACVFGVIGDADKSHVHITIALDEFVPASKEDWIEKILEWRGTDVEEIKRELAASFGHDEPECDSSKGECVAKY